MQKNVASQKLMVFAFDATTNLPKTGDAANLTAYVSKDYGTATVLGDTTATEMDSTNAKGYYLFDLTQGESNADTLLFSGKSSTANIVVVGAPAVVFTTPPNFSLASIDGSGRVDVAKVGGTSQTARDLGASVLLSVGTGTGQVNLASGKVPATVASGDLTLATDQITSASVSAAAVTKIQAGLATPTNITAGTITTVATTTNLTNLPAVPTDWLTAAGVKADAVTKIQANLALASQIPANFTTATFASAGVFSVSALANAPSGTGASAATIAAAVWDEPLASHATAGSTGVALAAAGSAGDPWSTTIPGSYGAGTAGALVGGKFGLAIAAGKVAASLDVANVTGDLPANLVAVNGGSITTPSRIDANLVAVNGNDVTGANVPANVMAWNNVAVSTTVPLAASAYATPPTAVQVRQEIDANSTQFAAIKAKTDGLPSDPADESLVIDATNAIMARLGAPGGASISADLAAKLATSGYTVPPTASAIASTLLGTTGLAVRALDGIADASLTVGDCLVAAVSGAAGKEDVIGTAYRVRTPSTGTVIRTFTLDDATAPSSRS
jgi:hypothetical protein